MCKIVYALDRLYTTATDIHHERWDMIETYKLLHDKYYGEYSQLVKLHASHISREGTRGHSFKLCQEGSQLNLRRQSFPVRITKVGN